MLALRPRVDTCTHARVRARPAPARVQRCKAQKGLISSQLLNLWLWLDGDGFNVGRSTCHCIFVCLPLLLHIAQGAILTPAHVIKTARFCR